MAELPRITLIVTEDRIHQLECTRCDKTTAGSLPDGVSGGCFGLFLQAALATLAGAYRLSKRRIQQIAHVRFGLKVSIGMIAKLERQTASVLEAPYAKLPASVQHANVVNLDETSWRENRNKAWLWTAWLWTAWLWTVWLWTAWLWTAWLATAVTHVATVLFIAARRTREVAESILGDTAGRIVGSVASRGDLAQNEWGTNSETGSRLVERMRSVVATCIHQKRDALEYLSSCLLANRRGPLSPSLLPATTERIVA